jgi:hypothetical protein
MKNTINGFVLSFSLLAGGGGGAVPQHLRACSYVLLDYGSLKGRFPMPMLLPLE